MSADDALKGLTCPKCGGVIPIPEGQAIVHCPYCDLRSVVSGERGLRRYQAPTRVTREQAAGALKDFLSGKWAIARDAARQAEVKEVFLAHLPFWTSWGRATAWAFGEKKVGSGDNERYEPREVRIVEDLSWNGPACDVGEFGVSRVPIEGVPLEPFDADALHASGLVFDPIGSLTDALHAAEADFQERLRSKAKLDRIAQFFVRVVRRRMGLVYYPLWVLRYQYRARSFQVVVDGFSGKVLYGKAPGNTLYRAGVLVGGMALGAFLTVDVPSLLLSGSSDDSDGLLGGLIAAVIFGVGLMITSYRKFRYGEQYEFGAPPKGLSLNIPGMIKNRLPGANQVNEILRMVNK